MDYSTSFARHFARLVWLLLHEERAVAEQKTALRALVTISQDGAVTFSVRDWRLYSNELPVPEALDGVQELTAQMIGHCVAELAIDAGVVPADLLGVARILAAQPLPGDGGRQVMDKLQALDACTVRVTLRHPALNSADVPQVGAAGIASGPPAAPGPATTGRAGPHPPTGVASERADTRSDGTVDARPAVSVSPRAPAARGAPAATTREAMETMFAQLDATRSSSAVNRHLDALVHLADDVYREGRVDEVADAFVGVVRREEKAADPTSRRAYSMAVRRLSKPTLLRAVASLLPRWPGRRDDLLAVLSRGSEDGAEAVIEELNAAQSMAARRTFFDALVHIKAGIPALTHMLRDPRWYVARNAADLLGEMQADSAEGELMGLLKHNDDRVRRAAAGALAKLGTTSSVQGLRVALKDSATAVRVRAAGALGRRRGLKSAATLIRALDTEEDSEVQIAILSALGRLATPDAVQKLIKAAQPESRFFKKKPVAYRLAAVQALGEARTPTAMAALQELLQDRDKELRAAVYWALTGHRKEAEPVTA